MAEDAARLSDLTSPRPVVEEEEFEATLRPKSFDEFVGQHKLAHNLLVFMKAALQRGEPLDHLLFHGPPGLGKTTLAHIVAHTMDAEMRATSGPAIERPADLAGILTNLPERGVLFIDEVHRLSHIVEEYLYPAMEDYVLDIVIDRGPRARSVKLNLPPFTLIGATTRAGLITPPLRARFGIVGHLDFYQSAELEQILVRSARIMGVKADDDGIREIACRARGTPRIANRLLRRVRDFAQVEGDGTVSRAVAVRALGMLEVDELGLDLMDKRILGAIIDKFSGGPVGLHTLAVAVGEEADTIEEVYEPYLVQEGFLNRTPRGRLATEKALHHFGKGGARTREQTDMFERGS
jgi:Holliday junction DNA helicase RuvB